MDGLDQWPAARFCKRGFIGPRHACSFTLWLLWGCSSQAAVTSHWACRGTCAYHLALYRKSAHHSTGDSGPWG